MHRDQKKCTKQYSLVKTRYLREDIKRIFVKKQHKFAIIKSCINPNFQLVSMSPCSGSLIYLDQMRLWSHYKLRIRSFNFFFTSISILSHGTFFCRIHTIQVELYKTLVVKAKNGKVLQRGNFTTREFLQSNQSCYLNLIIRRLSANRWAHIALIGRADK